MDILRFQKAKIRFSGVLTPDLVLASFTVGGAG
ncbi:MAG: hypothetical protein ACI94D_000957, partial [Neolewinella sp.]